MTEFRRSILSSKSVASLVRNGCIFPEETAGFAGMSLQGGDRAFFRRQGELGVELEVVEANGGGVFDTKSIVDPLDARPVDRAEAHRAGFAGGVDLTVGEAEVADLRAGGADGGDFAVGGGVVVPQDLVPTFADDFAIAHDDRAEWSAVTSEHAISGEFDGAAHESRIGVHDGRSIARWAVMGREMGRAGAHGGGVSRSGGLLGCFDRLKVELRTLAEPSDGFCDQFRLVRTGVALQVLAHA